MDTKKYDATYDFLSDNGFFNDSEMYIESAENHQLETVDKEKDLLSDVGELEDALAGVSGFVGTLLFVTTIIESFVNDALKENAVLMIIGAILLLVAIKSAIGFSTTKVIYLKRKHLKYSQTAYTLDFNCRVVPIRFIGILWSKGKATLKCELKNVAEECNDWKSHRFNDDEVFPTQQEASSAAADIKQKRRVALYPILGDETEIFLNSSMLNKYADLFYLNYKVKTCIDNTSFRDFLMNKESLLAFCKFVDEQKKKEKEEAAKLNAEEKTIDAFMKNHFKSEDGADL